MTEHVWKLPDNRIVDDRTLRKAIPEFLTPDLFTDMLDNEYPGVTILGKEYDAGRALRLVDPGRFDDLYRMQLDDFYKDREHGALSLLGIERMTVEDPRGISRSIRSRRHRPWST